MGLNNSIDEESNQSIKCSMGCNCIGKPNSSDGFICDECWERMS